LWDYVLFCEILRSYAEQNKYYFLIKCVLGKYLTPSVVSAQGIACTVEKMLTRVFGSIVNQLYAGGYTPSVDQASYGLFSEVDLAWLQFRFKHSHSEMVHLNHILFDRIAVSLQISLQPEYTFQ